ncbi:hypothetical protein TNCV_4749381 [Trichonephila clavipes]|nr:hypothetical protein TNCV_4749381 [Trichonephila clavipes]
MTINVTLSVAEFLSIDLVNLNHAQVTRTTPELSPPSPNFDTTSTGGHFNLDIFNVHRPPLQAGSSAVLDLTFRLAGMSVTLTIRLLMP